MTSRDNFSADERQEALRPLASLISKSAKAQQKLAPGSWQYTMLQNNLKALNYAFALMNSETEASPQLTRDELQNALQALAAMIGKTEASMLKFAPGTSQHTLQHNRLKALRIAQAQIEPTLDSGESAG